MAQLIDQARGFLSASQFFRNALYHEMERAGVQVPEKLLYGRDRKGKGGRPRKDSPVEAILEEESLKVAEAPSPAPESQPQSVTYPKVRRPKAKKK